MICEVGTSGGPFLVSGETGGDIGNAFVLVYVALILGAMVGDLSKLSRRTGSGGDMRVVVMSIWCFRSMFVDCLMGVEIGLMKEEDWVVIDETGCELMD